jgi:hypothetical protein
VTGMDWIHLAEVKDRRSALVQTVMNICVPSKLEIYCVAKRLLAV